MPFQPYRLFSIQLTDLLQKSYCRDPLVRNGQQGVTDVVHSRVNNLETILVLIISYQE